MKFADYRAAGKTIKIFEGFLDAREKADELLSEAGYDYDTLREAIASGVELDERLVESGASTDFANYLADKVTKRLMWGYAEQTSSWRQFTRTYSVPDFKPISFVRLTEMQNLLEVEEGADYKDSQISEIVGPSITVRTRGRLFKLSRKAIINDDLQQLADRPNAMGRAAARTLGHDVVAKLEANLNTYDGNAMFSSAHRNVLVGSDAFLSEDSVAQASTLLRLQTDPNGNRIGLAPRNLIIPAQLEMVSMRILRSTIVAQPQEGIDPVTPTAGFWPVQQFGRGNENVVRALAAPIVEAYLEDANDWYLFADQQEAPVLGVGFLNGDETPDIFLRDPGMRNVLGGSDPYSMEYDEIAWKVRHEWGVAPLDWRGAVKAIVP